MKKWRNKGLKKRIKEEMKKCRNGEIVKCKLKKLETKKPRNFLIFDERILWFWEILDTYNI